MGMKPSTASYHIYGRAKAQDVSQVMKRTIAAITTGVMLIASSPVLAGGGHRHGHYGHHHGRDKGGDEAAYLVGGLLGGLLIGSLLTQKSYRQSSYAPAPVYTAPLPRARYDCQPTSGTGYLNGRLASYGGTFCYDANGNGYVVPGSVYFIGYLQ